MEDILNYINGELKPAISGATLPNINPATGKIYGWIPRSDHRDVVLAFSAAETAFPTWSNTPAAERAKVLRNVARLIDENLELLARAESKDNGKPVSLARAVDIPRAAQNMAFFASAAEQMQSESHYMEGTAINYTLRRPLGVVGCISPWNLPLYLFTWKIAPALAAGNCVIAKPSEITPYSAYLFSKLCMDAGMPAGVLNIIHGLGPEVGNALVCHPEVKAISFTGGTTTGAHIATTCAPLFKKLSLELGGKNPTLIFADCDFDAMLSTVVRSSFANQGQICLCGSRILVEESIYERFRDAFVEKVSRIVPGDPSREGTKMGALVSEAHLNKVLSYVQLAKEEGGKVLTGGERVVLPGALSGGYYMKPAVIEGLSQSCRTNQEEIFGPVVTLAPFRDEAVALAMANASPYGLAASLWTENLSRAHRMAEQIECGIVWINCWLVRDLRTPFGGMKQSGVGREGGWEAMRFFTEPKNICIATAKGH